MQGEASTFACVFLRPLHRLRTQVVSVFVFLSLTHARLIRAFISGRACRNTPITMVRERKSSRNALMHWVAFSEFIVALMLFVLWRTLFIVYYLNKTNLFLFQCHRFKIMDLNPTHKYYMLHQYTLVPVERAEALCGPGKYYVQFRDGTIRPLGNHDFPEARPYPVVYPPTRPSTPPNGVPLDGGASGAER